MQYATTGEVNLQDVAMAAVSGSVGPVGIAQKAAKFGKAVLKAAKKIKESKGDTPRCFVEGTLVHTPNGLIPIEEIQVGDLVASRDVLTGDTTWKPVARLYRHSDKSIFNLTLVNAAGEKERLGVTPEHPFWVEGQGWIDAGQRQEGQIISSVDGKVLTVNSIMSVL